MKTALFFLAASMLSGSCGQDSSDRTGGVNLLQNGDFSDGTSGWSLRNNDGGAAVMNAENGELKIDIACPAPGRSGIALRQGGLKIETGNAYTLRFRARADSVNLIFAVVRSGQDPDTSYSDFNKTRLAAESDEYNYTFFMTRRTDENAELVFFMGGEDAGAVYVDSIVLKKIINEEKEIDYPVVIPNADYSNLILYEIHPGSYDVTWQSGERLKAITDRLDRIKRLGINCVWINPVFEGQGSGYWTYDYYKISHRLGTLNDMKKLVYEAHRRDMLVIIDLVINHVWLQHPFFQDVIARGSASPYADWFLWNGKPGSSGFDKPPMETQLASINFDNPAAKEYMFTAAEYWLQKLDIDGYRVDMALVLERRHPGVSRELIKRLEAIKPGIFMLAEGYAGDVNFFYSGYDSAYDWDIRSTDWFPFAANALNKVFEGSMTLERMHDYLSKPKAGGGLPLRFAENHDMKRAVSQWGIGGSKAAHTVVMMSRGCVMFFGGGEVAAAPDHPEVPWSQLDPFVWDYSCPLYEYFSRLGGIRRRYLKSDLLQYWIPNNNAGVYSSLSASGSSRLITVANFSGAAQTVTLRLTVPRLGTITRLTDLLTGTDVPYSGGGTLTLSFSQGYETVILLIQ